MRLINDSTMILLISLGLYETAQVVYSHDYFKYISLPGGPLNILRRKIADAGG